ncbi:MAG TPA: glycosyl hydrolase 53 family protein [Polyangiaceae bacterium]|nr:glycosyl hydrolase 53 family protein [Polyangiaceae bacterium]
MQRPSFFALALGASAIVNCSSGENTPGGTAATGTSATAGAAGKGGTGSAGGAGAPEGGKSAGSGGASAAAGAMTGGTAGTTPGGAAGTVSGTSGAGGSGMQGGSAGLAAGGGDGGASAGKGAAAGMAGGGSGGAAAGMGGAAGKGTGGAAGSGGTALPFSFYIGADITDQEPQSESTRASLLTLMKSHGFNTIRLRTFVDPKASDGYDKQNGYADLAHTISFGKQIKDAGMGFLLDFHYSDNWADPGKQCVPVAWQSLGTIDEMATALHDYTKDAIEKLIAGGARPDMVQIGNETTPGMCIHKCDSGGQPTGTNSVNGSASNWGNLGKLLKAGANAVLEVDSAIVISLHIDKGDEFGSTKSWIDNAVKQGVPFTAFGESCYQKYQGDPSSTTNTKNGWTSTFTQLASTYPDIKFFAAEYGPMQREINDVLYALPENQGIGTFNWEPTTQGDWNTGHDLIRRTGTTYTAQPDLALYDDMMTAYADRL